MVNGTAFLVATVERPSILKDEDGVCLWTTGTVHLWASQGAHLY